MNIIKNYLYNVGYQLFIIIIPLVTVPYIARVLGSEGVGINAYTNSIIQYFILFGSIGINLYGNRTIAYTRDDRRKTGQIFWEIAILRMLCILVSYIIFLIFLYFISEYKTFYFYQSFLIIAAAFDISWFFMGIEDFKKTVLRNMYVKVLSLIAVFIFVKTKEDVGIYILILSLSVFFGNLTLWPYLRKLVDFPNIKDFSLKRHLRPSISLFIPQIATQVYLVLNKTMLGSMIGVESAGYYENSDKIVKIILAIVTATGTVMLPRIANTFAKGNKEKVKEYLYQSFDFVSFISIPMSLGLLALAPKFSIWFLGEDFAITGILISILSLVIVLIGWSNVLGTQFLLPTNQTRYYTISVLMGAGVNIILNIPLILYFGVIGAVVATVISELAVTGTQFYYVRKTVNTGPFFRGIWKYLIAGITMVVIIRPLNLAFPGKLVFFLMEICIGILIYGLLIFILKAPIVSFVKDFFKKTTQNNL